MKIDESLPKLSPSEVEVGGRAKVSAEKGVRGAFENHLVDDVHESNIGRASRLFHPLPESSYAALDAGDEPLEGSRELTSGESLSVRGENSLFDATRGEDGGGDVENGVAYVVSDGRLGGKDKTSEGKSREGERRTKTRVLLEVL